MFEIGLTAAVISLYMLLFRLVGTAVLALIGQKGLFIRRETVGFFAYFSLFQILYVPMVLLKAPFHLLAYGWVLGVVILALLCGVYLVSVGGKHPFAMPQTNPSRKVFISDKREERVIGILVIIGAAAFIIFLVLQQYLGWDTAFYMGNMNEAVYTDTMYHYNGNDGTLVKHMDLRYALSGFCMHFTIPCFLLGIPPVIMCYYGVRALGAILCMLIVYDFGLLIFNREKSPAYICVAVFLAVNLLLFSHSATSLFFIRRMYEPKGYCANVVLPMTVLALALIYGRLGKHLWVLLFVIAFGSVGASMSSMMLVPAAIGIGSVVIAVSERRFRPVIYGVICAIPNLCYALLYIASTLGGFSIEIP